MLLPALNRARETARSASCINNLKTIGTAQAMYTSSNDDWLLPLKVFNSSAHPQQGLWFNILAGLDETGKEHGTYGAKSGYQFDGGTVRYVNGTFNCPGEALPCDISLPSAKSFYYTHYAANRELVGELGATWKARKVTMVKGPGGALFVGDSAYSSGWNAYAGSYAVKYRHGGLDDRMNPAWNSDYPFGYRGRANILYVDGHTASRSSIELYDGGTTYYFRTGFNKDEGATF